MVSHDGNSGYAQLPPSEAVVWHVADCANTDPENLPPLTNAINPDALDDLVVETGRPTRNGSAHVVFSYYNHSVVVHEDGTITVYKPGEMESLLR